MSGSKILLGCALAFYLTHAPAVTATENITLTITVTGASPNTGQNLLSVFDSPASYLKSPSRNLKEHVDDSGKTVFLIPNLLSGVYAISVVYDKDGNGELNTGLFGIPTELVGFSNNARGIFGPPSFDKTKIELTESQNLEIRLKKAKK